jgi:hypothetical protein
LSNGNHSISSIVDPEQNGADNGGGGHDVDERVVDPIILRRNVGQQKRWSCKEELAFYRTLMAIGVKVSISSTFYEQLFHMKVFFQFFSNYSLTCNFFAPEYRRQIRS